MNERLIVFTKYPTPGKCKTRLIPALGPDGAAEMHSEMVRHTLAQAAQAHESRGVDVEVSFTGADAKAMAECFGDQFSYQPQVSGDLGKRLATALHRSLDEGAGRVLFIGTDCPGISPSLLTHAFDRLDTHDVVLGPATDGGYYLIGLKQPESHLFEEIAWGTETVLGDTLDRISALGRSVSLLPTLEDVDRPEDLAGWEAIRCGERDIDRAPLLSIIIPTLNVEQSLETAIASAQTEADAEIVLAAAGSIDGTLQAAVKHRCQFIAALAGRGIQLNAGAAVARGSILLFLHADTQLPPGYGQVVTNLLSQSDVVLGAFQLAIDAPGTAYRLIERGTRWRSRWRQLPYGDQALFLRRDTFEQMGGFAEIPLMEDYEFVRRLRKLGRIVTIDAPVLTSARRWQRLGPWRTTATNQLIVLAYHLGVSPERLAAWYRRKG